MFFTNYRCQNPSDRTDFNGSHIFHKLSVIKTGIDCDKWIVKSGHQPLCIPAAVSRIESQSSENESSCLIWKVSEFLTLPWLLSWETSVGLYTGVNVEITSLSSFLSFHTAVQQIDTRSPKKAEIRNEFGQMMEWKLYLLLMSHDKFMFCYWLITKIKTIKCSNLLETLERDRQ